MYFSLPVDKEGVASFLRLLLSMLDNSPTNQQVFFLSEGPATIGALLQKVPPSCLTVQALTAIQQLTEQFSQHSEQRYGVYKHLLFNFKIWSRPSFTVRIGQSLGDLSHSHSSCLLHIIYSILILQVTLSTFQQ